MTDASRPAPRRSEPGRPRGTLATALVEQLRRAVLSGDLLPGQRLRLEDLRDRYAVSLSPLREAISRLGSEGLLLLEDQRGVRVAPVSRENLAEVVSLRCDLEPKALRESIRLGGDAWEADVTTAHVMLSRQEKSDEGSQRVERWEQLHRHLHMALLSACGMPLLLQFCSMLNDRGDRYRRLFLTNEKVGAAVMAEHAAIVDASLARQADLACERLRAHIADSARFVYEALARQQAP